VFNGKANTLVLESEASGYGGKIGFVVAINIEEENLHGVGVTTHTETPGLGGEAKDDPSFSAQFKGKSISTPILVTNDGGDINAIGGATITSRAVCKGTMQAIETYNKLKPQLLEELKKTGK
jgi:electron transport complex protein RnfG